MPAVRFLAVDLLFVALTVPAVALMLREGWRFDRTGIGHAAFYPRLRRLVAASWLVMGVVLLSASVTEFGLPATLGAMQIVLEVIGVLAVVAALGFVGLLLSVGESPAQPYDH